MPSRPTRQETDPDNPSIRKIQQTGNMEGNAAKQEKPVAAEKTAKPTKPAKPAKAFLETE